MAAWQFDLYLAPKARMIAEFGEIPTSVGPIRAHEAEWWKGVELPTSFEQFTKEVFPEREYRAPTMREWGNTASDCLRLTIDEGKPDDLFARIDVRRRNSHFVEKLIVFASRHECVFVIPDGTVLRPEVGILLQEIRQSRAASFVKNPEQYLDDLGSSSG